MKIKVIKHVGKLATFLLEDMMLKKTSYLKIFVIVFKKIGLKIIFKKNIKEKIWEKFIFLSAYSGMTTFF